MAVTVTPYDSTDEAALDAAHRVVAAAQAVDLPTCRWGTGPSSGSWSPIRRTAT